MPHRPRLAAGDLAYHVLNRRVGRLPLFENAPDCHAFEQILAEAHARFRIRIAAYCLMPNHWHLLLWPRQDGELSEILRWYMNRFQILPEERALGSKFSEAFTAYKRSVRRWV